MERRENVSESETGFDMDSDDDGSRHSADQELQIYTPVPETRGTGGGGIDNYSDTALSELDEGPHHPTPHRHLDAVTFARRSPHLLSRSRDSQMNVRQESDSSPRPHHSLDKPAASSSRSGIDIFNLHWVADDTSSSDDEGEGGVGFDSDFLGRRDVSGHSGSERRTNPAVRQVAAMHNVLVSVNPTGAGCSYQTTARPPVSR